MVRAPGPVTVDLWKAIPNEKTGRYEMKIYLKQFWNDTQGQDLVEYALAAGMVAVAAVAAMPALSTTVNQVFNKISSIITSAVQ